MAVIISKASVHWGDAFLGYVPSKTVIQSNALYTCTYAAPRALSLTDVPVAIGIIGATVMPHSLFLGSALATQDRVDHLPEPAKETQLRELDTALSAASELTSGGKRAPFAESFKASLRRHFRIVQISDSRAPLPASHAEHENRPYSFVRIHLYHGIVDMVVSLLGLAVVINSM